MAWRVYIRCNQYSTKSEIKLERSQSPPHRNQVISFQQGGCACNFYCGHVAHRTIKRQRPKYEKDHQHTHTSCRRQWLRDGCSKGVNWMKNNLQRRHTHQQKPPVAWTAERRHRRVLSILLNACIHSARRLLLWGRRGPFTTTTRTLLNGRAVCCIPRLSANTH